MSEKEYYNSTCPLCQKEGKKLFITKDKIYKKLEIFHVFHCRNCHVDFIECPKNLEDYYSNDYFSNLINEKDLLFRIKSHIISNYYTASNIINKKVYGFLLGFISALPRKQGRIMDVGCGPGDILYLLKKVGFDVYGLDISKYAVEAAHKNGLENVIQGMEDKLIEFPDEFFDCIRGSHVIEHMPDPVKFLNLCRKKLKKNGLLILATPNINSLNRAIFKEHTKCYRDIPRHIIIFSKNGIVKLLEEAGFESFKVTYKNMFSDFYEGLFCFLDDKFKILNTNIGKKLYRNIFINFLLLPIDFFFIMFKKGETMTITAKKNVKIFNE